MTILNVSANHALSGLIAAAAIVKVIAFFVAWVTAWLPIAIPFAKRINWNSATPLVGEQKLPILASLYLVAPVIVLGATWVERTSLADYCLSWQLTIITSLTR